MLPSVGLEYHIKFEPTIVMSDNSGLSFLQKVELIITGRTDGTVKCAVTASLSFSGQLSK